LTKSQLSDNLGPLEDPVEVSDPAHKCLEGLLRVVGKPTQPIELGNRWQTDPLISSPGTQGIRTSPIHFLRAVAAVLKFLAGPELQTILREKPVWTVFPMI